MLVEKVTNFRNKQVVPDNVQERNVSISMLEYVTLLETVIYLSACFKVCYFFLTVDLILGNEYFISCKWF